MDEKALRAAGVDYDAALARFMGKRDIYEKYLGRYLQDEHAQDAQKAMVQRDYQALLEQVHALKGLTGTLGLIPLYETSCELVSDLRTGNYGALEAKMCRLQIQQEQICAVIQRQ